MSTEGWRPSGQKVVRRLFGRRGKDESELLGVYGEGGCVVRGDIEVGDWVLVRSDGGSPAAKKYAGKQGRATMVGPGFDGTVIDVRIDGNDFDTVFEERDLAKQIKEMAS